MRDNMKDLFEIIGTVFISLIIALIFTGLVTHLVYYYGPEIDAVSKVAFKYYKEFLPQRG